MYSKFRSYCSAVEARGGTSFTWDPWADYEATDDSYEVEMYASILHDVYCQDSSCSWEDEEQEVEVPVQVLPHHFKWVEFAEALTQIGITPEQALSCQKEIYRLAGWDPSY